MRRTIPSQVARSAMASQRLCNASRNAALKLWSEHLLQRESSIHCGSVTWRALKVMRVSGVWQYQRGAWQQRNLVQQAEERTWQEERSSLQRLGDRSAGTPASRSLLWQHTPLARGSDQCAIC